MSDSTSPTPGSHSDTSADDPTDMSVDTFDSAAKPAADSDDGDVRAVDAVADALPGGGRLDSPDDDVSGPVQVA